MLGFFNERKLVIETRKDVFSQPDVMHLGVRFFLQKTDANVLLWVSFMVLKASSLKYQTLLLK